MSWFGGSSHPAHPHKVQTEAEAFWYLHLNTDQQHALEKFEAHLRETGAALAGHDDRFTLLRFLKARQWDVHRATVMYTHMTKWRTEHGTDKLYAAFTFPEEEAVLKHYPHFYHKSDIYGRPVYIELLGQSDCHKMLEHTSLERLLDYHVVEWERLQRDILPACSQLAGRPIITRNVVLDLKGVSLRMFGATTQKILRAISVIDQDYYCERLGQMFIINTPSVFRAIWAVINPLLEERTRRKIVILGSDYLPTLTQLVPLEDLPTVLGGKSHVPDYRTSIGAWTSVQLPANGANGAAPEAAAAEAGANGAAAAAAAPGGKEGAAVKEAAGEGANAQTVAVKADTGAVEANDSPAASNGAAA